MQIIVNNLDSGRHPFHLHGHHFQALYRSEDEAGTFEDANVTEADFPATPMRRDTFVLYPDGNIVLRFRADNPGKAILFVTRIMICTFLFSIRLYSSCTRFPLTRNFLRR